MPKVMLEDGQVVEAVAVTLNISPEEIERMGRYSLRLMEKGDNAKRIADANARTGGIFGNWRASKYYKLANRYYRDARSAILEYEFHPTLRGLSRTLSEKLTSS